MIAYFVLACGITWLLLSPLVLSHQGIVSFHLSPHWHFLGGLGPTAAAALVAHRKGLWVAWVRGLLHWRVGAGWLLLSAASPFLFFLIGYLAAVLARSPITGLEELRTLEILSAALISGSLVSAMRSLWLRGFRGLGY